MFIRNLIIFLGLFIGLSSLSYGQNTTVPKPNYDVPVSLPKLVKLKTPDSEVGDAILFLENMKDHERRFIRFFTTYAIADQTLRQHEILVTSFLCHSMTGATNKEFVGGGFYPLAHMDDQKKFVANQLVPGSDTLYWINILDFNWTEQAWETIAKEDPYFVEPIVTHEKNGALRLMAGNAVLRADWFNSYSSDITRQSDVGSQTKIYKELLYGSLGKAPKNVAEFEQAWAIDTKKSRDIGNASAALVTKSKAVARNNRILFGYRTELGWYYRTYDVKHQRGLRDYAENILDFKGNPPPVFDGGELFATNLLHLQVYDLYDDKENLVDAGDAGLVRHPSDVLADNRVRTAHSCYDCHAAGPIPSENTLREFLRARGKAKVYDYKDQLRINRVLLSTEFDDSINDNQTMFARSLEKTNGLKPEENVKYYLQSVVNYSKPLTIEQAAFECGLTVESFKESVTNKNKVYPDKVPFRLGLLLKTGEPIDRSAWDSPGADGQPGIFQQAMVLIHGLTKIVEKESVSTVITDQHSQVAEIVIGNENISNILIATEDGEIRTGNTILGRFKVGDELEANGQVQLPWIGVKTIDGQKGYVLQKSVKSK